MFFLGILSSPLPYLLLALFYVYGFTSSISTRAGDKTNPDIQPLAIQVQTGHEKPVHPIDWAQAEKFSKNKKSVNHNLTKNTVAIIFVDIIHNFPFFREIDLYKSFFTSFLFSRPPPSVC